MRLDPTVLRSLAVRFDPTGYLRATPVVHAATPLGMAYGKSRFASPIDAFKVLYVAENLDTAIAEAIIRDRFEGRTRRRFTEEEACDWGVTEVTAKSWLTLIDLRTTGSFRLGVSTNAAQGKNQKLGRRLSQAIYDGTDADGILYPSRLTRAACAAIYDRAVEPNLTATPVQEIVTLADFVPALKRLDVTLIRAWSAPGSTNS